MHTDFEQTASEIYNEIFNTNSNVKKIDPMTLISLASLLVNLVRMFQGCGHTPSSAKSSMQNLSFLHRVKLRSEIRKHINQEDEGLTRREVRAKVEKTMEKLGKEVTLEQLEKFWEEAKNE